MRKDGIVGKIISAIQSLQIIKGLEVVSKPQIRLKSKAQADEKAQHTR